MLIQSLEQKTKLALATVILTLAACTAICIFTVYQSSKLVSEERSQIYILDGDIPFLAEPRRISNFSISTSSTCLPTTITSSGRSARPSTWLTERR